MTIKLGNLLRPAQRTEGVGQNLRRHPVVPRDFVAGWVLHDLRLCCQHWNLPAGGTELAVPGLECLEMHRMMHLLQVWQGDVCVCVHVMVCHSMSSYVMIWRCVQQGCYVWSILRMISAEKADLYRFLEWSTKNTPDISEACICCDHIQYLTPFGQGSWSFWLTLQLTVCRNSTLVWLRACSYFLKTCMVAHRYKSELNWPHVLALQSKSIQVQCSHPSARL